MPESIDELLLKSSTDSKYYCQFIDCLIDSNVYVPCIADDIYIWKNNNGNLFAPFFSTLEALKKGVFIATKISNDKHIKITGKEFFRRLPSIDAVLNPNFFCSKEFTINEIQWLKKQLALKWLLKFSSSKEALIYQPIKKPSAILDELCQIFKKYDEIKLASYSKISISESEIIEYDLVGLKIHENFNKIFYNVADELNNHEGKFETLRIIDLEQKNEIAYHLKKNGYFYNIN